MLPILQRVYPTPPGENTQNPQQKNVDPPTLLSHLTYCPCLPLSFPIKPSLDNKLCLIHLTIAQHLMSRTKTVLNGI